MLKAPARISWLLVGASVAAAGCAQISPPCATGLMRYVRAELFFGRSAGGRAMVSDEEWRQFLDAEVTPRFPEGFSVADVNGQWRNAAETIVREPSKEVVIVLPAGNESQAKLGAIRDAYRRRFNQDSVLLVETPACAAF